MTRKTRNCKGEVVKTTKCETKFCRCHIPPSRTAGKCSKCRTRAYKEKYPLKRAYYTLKGRAKERSKVFTLTYEQFEKIARESGWSEGRGKEADSLSLDRIDDRKGYEVGNLRAITLSANTTKENRRRFAPLTGYLRDLFEKELDSGEPF